MPRLVRISSILFSILILLTAGTFGAGRADAQTSVYPQTKLVLILMVDQFNYEYLSRFSDKFGQGGFRYLMDNGANYLNCRTTHATTSTAVGHSVVSTGALPWATGIVGNEWYDRRRDKDVEAIADDSVQMVGANGVGASSKALIGSTIGDEMKLATNGRSKIITCSLKNRASLMLAGRMANSAYWWDLRSGNFVTSSQFGTTLPAWVKAFNDRHYSEAYFGKPWQRLLPENMYTASTRDDYTYERSLPGDGRQFPHVITGGASGAGEAFFTTFAATPFANQMLADFAKDAIEKENLGQHTDPDLLGVSFSATDYLGHDFGPYSQEVQDMYLRLDQTLASFFQFVDQKVGLDKTLIVFTSDHGVMPIPEFLKERGLDAGRIDTKSFKTLLDAALDQKLGADDWVSSFEPPNLYLNLATIDKQKYRQPEVEQLAAKLAHQIPGIAEAYTAAQFFTNQVPAGPFADMVRKSYFWGRSGELYIVPKSGYVFCSEPNGTGHGSPYRYDSQIPLILMGSGVKPGRYGQDASLADIAPTIAAVLGVGAPSQAEGRVLYEAMSQTFGPSRPLNLQPAAAPQQR